MIDYKNTAKQIYDAAIKESLPDAAVKKALEHLTLPKGKLVLIAFGKAAWQMADAAVSVLGNAISEGVVITKYNHVMGYIDNVICYEAGHPVPDENSYIATDKAVGIAEKLGEDDEVLLLISGGGSALFELPEILPGEMASITKQLLSSGADIVEMNTVRKRISSVKGGKFAQICAPAKVFSIVLSDIIGDPLDMIASGPAYPDSSTCEDAMRVVEKYGIELSDRAKAALEVETPKTLSGVETYVTGSVKLLTAAAAEKCRELGYETVLLTSSMHGTAREIGSFLGTVAKDHAHDGKKLAFVCGGETVVKCTGNGKGGRNQEIAISAGLEIAGLDNVAVFSVGSDGTDGPTDAAGGICDGSSAAKIAESGKKGLDYLDDNDSYNALKSCDGLIITGPTGTNVNDFSVVLVN